MKGGANPSPLTTPVFIGVSGEKVKGKIESRIFLTQKQLRKLLPNRSHSPIEIYLPTYDFLPGNGTILPQLRAILCHCQAKSGISLLSHLNRAHSLMLHALLAE